MGRFGALVAHEPWGPSMDDATVFTHELGHTASGFNLQDHVLNLNVSNAENTFRGWAGSPPRMDYAIRFIGQAPDPVASRGVWANLTHPWY